MKGNVMDLILISVILIVAGLSILIAYTVFEPIYSMEPFASNPTIVDSWTTQKASLAILANSFIIIFIVFSLATAISAFFTDTHPVFFVFSILMLAICVMIISIFADMFLELAAHSLLLPAAAEFTLMIETVANMRILSLIMGAVIIIALYAKRGIRLGGGEA